MLTRLVLPLILAAGCGFCQAQTLPGSPATPAFTQADTVRAIHQLFKSKRRTGGWLVGGSAAVTAVAAVGTATEDNHGSYVNLDAPGAALFFGIGTAPAWLPGTISLLRFTRKREQQAIANYERTRTLPHYVGRKLAARFFAASLPVQQSN